jgi:hypothetical protein
MVNKNYLAIREPANPVSRQTQTTAGPLRYQNNFQPLSNFYPQI